jgi:hypothetical protein
MKPEDIAFPRSVNGVKKYTDSTSIYKKGTPMHVKGAIMYNHLIKTKKIGHKFQPIYEGDKGKYIHLRKNLWGVNVITFISKLPKEFDLHGYIDYETQFQKSFMDPLRFILGSINWQIDASDSNTIEDFFN